MESAALSGLISLVGSNVMHGRFQGFPDDGQKITLHVAIICLVVLTCFPALLSGQPSGTNHEDGASCVPCWISIFSAFTAGLLSACVLPLYFTLVSGLVCLITVLVNIWRIISDTPFGRWVRGLFSNRNPLLPLFQVIRSVIFKSFYSQALPAYQREREREGI